jgi:DNA primase
VKKVGADEFRSFVKDHKKDFILFQLDIALSDAGNDSTKKAAVVNQMAESISKLSRAEDFTRQQDYIKRCSHLLKIDEQGLTALVQKFTREKLGKEEKKLQRENIVDQNSAAVEQQEAVIDLLFKDEMNEQAVLRSLIEFGSKPWENDKTVADYIFEEIEKDGLEELFDNKGLIQLLQSYKAITQGGSHPSEKHFLYHTDPAINQTAVSLLSEKHAISPNWEKYYKGEIFGREELYKEEVISSMTYLKLKKIKRLIVENQRDLENNPSNDDMIILLQTHKHLKELEMDLMKNIGTVIFK